MTQRTTWGAVNNSLSDCLSDDGGDGCGGGQEARRLSLIAANSKRANMEEVPLSSSLPSSPPSAANNAFVDRSPLANQLTAMRLKLEEKRKSIEKDKSRLESKWTKERQRVGKAAFLKVVGASSKPGERAFPNSTSPNQDAIVEEKESPVKTPDISLVAGEKDSSPRVKGALEELPPAPSKIVRNRTYTEEEIKGTLEELRQKWFEEDRVEMTRKTSSSRGSSGRSSPLHAIQRDEHAVAGGRNSEDNTVIRGEEAGRNRTDSVGSARRDEASRSGSVGTSSPSPSPSGEYHHNIEQLNASLVGLEAEIQRLKLQQAQLKAHQQQFNFPHQAVHSQDGGMLDYYGHRSSPYAQQQMVPPHKLPPQHHPPHMPMPHQSHLQGSHFGGPQYSHHYPAYATGGYVPGIATPPQHYGSLTSVSAGRDSPGPQGYPPQGPSVPSNPYGSQTLPMHPQMYPLANAPPDPRFQAQHLYQNHPDHSPYIPHVHHQQQQQHIQSQQRDLNSEDYGDFRDSNQEYRQQNDLRRAVSPAEPQIMTVSHDSNQTNLYPSMASSLKSEDLQIEQYSQDGASDHEVFGSGEQNLPVGEDAFPENEPTAFSVLPASPREAFAAASPRPHEDDALPDAGRFLTIEDGAVETNGTKSDQFFVDFGDGKSEASKEGFRLPPSLRRAKKTKETAAIEPMKGGGKAKAAPVVARVVPVSQVDREGHQAALSLDSSDGHPEPSISTDVQETFRGPSSNFESVSIATPLPTPSLSAPKPGTLIIVAGGREEAEERQSPDSAVPVTGGSPMFSVDSAKLSDMEKKKQEMIMKQLKRREAQELKRIKREAEAAEKRQEEARKMEEVEAKKAAEKAKKEAIFQEYLKRKKEKELEEAGGAPAAPSRKPPPRSAGPKKKKSTGSGAFSSPVRGASPARRVQFYAKSGVDDENGDTDMTSSYPPPTGGSPTHLASKGKASSTLCQQPGDQEIPNQNEYTGPKLFVQPSGKTNKQIIVNAVKTVCLAGSVNADLKKKVLDELEKSEGKHFLILFRDAGCQYRGVFEFDPESERVEKLCGNGPKSISNEMLDKVFKYSSGQKKFTSIYAKQFSVSIDAFTIKDHLWQSAKSKTGPRPRPLTVYN